MLKTIFIPIFQGVEARNILRTDIFRLLSKESDLRLVLFVPSDAKREYYQREFSGANIFYEVFNSYQPRLLDRWIGKLKVWLLKTKTMDWKRRIRLAETGNLFFYGLSWTFNRLAAHSLVRRIVRFFDYHIVSNNDFKEVFNRWKPDMVFLITCRLRESLVCP